MGDSEESHKSPNFLLLPHMCVCSCQGRRLHLISSHLHPPQASRLVFMPMKTKANCSQHPTVPVLLWLQGQYCNIARTIYIYIIIFPCFSPRSRVSLSRATAFFISICFLEGSISICFAISKFVAPLHCSEAL